MTHDQRRKIDDDDYSRERKMESYLELGEDRLDDLGDCLCVSLGDGLGDDKLTLVFSARLSSLSADGFSLGVSLSNCLCLCFSLARLSTLSTDGFCDGFGDGLSSTGE